MSSHYSREDENLQCHVHTCILYSRKFSKDPIFANGPSAKISQSNFRGWTFQNREHAFEAFNFTDLIFVVNCQSTTKTAKIGSLETFWPYSSA